MARSDLPDALAKRHILYGEKANAPDQNAAGLLYLEEDRISEAVEFFIESGNEEMLREVRDRAVAQGNAFVLKRIDLRYPDLVPDEVWREAAGAAEEAGRLMNAVRALEAAGDDDEAAEIRRQIAESRGGARREAELLVQRLEGQYPSVTGVDRAGIQGLDKFIGSRRQMMRTPGEEIIPSLGAYIGEVLVGETDAEWSLVEPLRDSRVRLDDERIDPFEIAEKALEGEATLDDQVAGWLEEA